MTVAAAALLLAAASFVMGQIAVARRAKTDYVDELEKRVALCEKDRSDLRADFARLERSNKRLQERIDVLEEKVA